MEQQGLVAVDDHVVPDRRPQPDRRRSPANRASTAAAAAPDATAPPAVQFSTRLPATLVNRLRVAAPQLGLRQATITEAALDAFLRRNGF